MAAMAAILENLHNVIISLSLIVQFGRIKFGTSVQNLMPADDDDKLKIETGYKFPYGVRLFSKSGISSISAIDWDWKTAIINLKTAVFDGGGDDDDYDDNLRGLANVFIFLYRELRHELPLLFSYPIKRKFPAAIWWWFTLQI